ASGDSAKLRTQLSDTRAQLAVVIDSCFVFVFSGVRLVARGLQQGSNPPPFLFFKGVLLFSFWLIG
ncbi:hypothetical protein T492DRAFT_905705, partial [Pavlovales sp. CCMP2436]